MLQNPPLTKNTCYLKLTKNETSDTISLIKYLCHSIVFRSVWIGSSGWIRDIILGIKCANTLYFFYVIFRIIIS